MSLITHTEQWRSVLPSANIARYMVISATVRGTTLAAIKVPQAVAKDNRMREIHNQLERKEDNRMRETHHKARRPGYFLEETCACG